MQAGYFSTAWNDIKSTPGWVGKLFLLALITFIPIFGPIVVYGYLYGWARDIAWGVQGPMPKHIFGNEDGKLYSRGFFILVLGIVLALVPGIIYGISAAISGIGAASTASSYYYYSSPNYGALAIFGLIGGLIWLVGLVATFAVTFFQWVGSMRISIYGRISSGFQIKKIWAMIRKDTGGILRIFGMVLLIGLIVGIIVGIIFTIIFAILGVSIFGAIGSSYSSSYGYSSSSAVGSILAVTLIVIFFSVIFGYLTMVLGMWISALTTRALGYWTRQFDVPAWRGQDDPMPFELQQAAQKTAQATQVPYQPTPPAAQYQQPSPQPVVQQPVATPAQVPQQYAAPVAVAPQPETPVVQPAAAPAPAPVVEAPVASTVTTPAPAVDSAQAAAAVDPVPAPAVVQPEAAAPAAAPVEAAPEAEAPAPSQEPQVSPPGVSQGEADKGDA